MNEPILSDLPVFIPFFIVSINSFQTISIVNLHQLFYISPVVATQLISYQPPQRKQTNMLSITLLFTSVLAGFAVAQNSSTSFNANSVDLTTRSTSSCSSIAIGGCTSTSYADLDRQINGVKARQPIAPTSVVDLSMSPTLALV